VARAIVWPSPRRGTDVEDQRKLLRLPGTGPGIQAVRQGQLRGLIDDEGEAELPEIMAALFVVAALG